MKKVFEYVIHDETKIFAEGKILAENDATARVLIGAKESDVTDLSAPDVRITVRPFCER